MPGKIILFDLDRTLADYDAAMSRDLAAIASASETSDDEDQPWYCNRVKLIRNQPGWWRNLGRLQIGFDLLNEAINIGFDVHVLTKGPKKASNAWTEKFEWCKEHLPTAVNITVTRDKSTTYGLALVDDYKQYLLDWLDNRPRGWGIQPVAPGTKLDNWHPRIVQYDGTLVQMAKVRKVMTAVYTRNKGENPIVNI